MKSTILALFVILYLFAQVDNASGWFRFFKIGRHGRVKRGDYGSPGSTDVLNEMKSKDGESQSEIMKRRETGNRKEKNTLLKAVYGRFSRK